MSNQAVIPEQTPPHYASNVIMSQPKTVYLNKPKHYKEEDDATAENGSADTQTPGNPPSPEQTHDWQKRYSDLKSYHDKQTKAAEAREAEQARILAEKDKELLTAKQEPIKLPSTPDEVAAFKAKYGHLYNIIETVALQANTSTKAEFERVLKESDNRVKAIAAEKARAELLELHPDAFTLKSEPEFVKWYEDQIPSIKAMINSEFVQDVSRGLDIYKKDVGIIKKTQAQKEAESAAAAMNVPTRSIVEVGQTGGKIWKASEVAAIPTSKYRQYEAEILKAYAEGRFDPNN